MTVSVSLQGQFGDFDLDVAFDAPSGCISLFGRSGAGKTSVAQSIAGLRKIQRGRIAVDGDVLLDTETGQNTAAHQRRIGVIFQEARLFPHLDVTQNLTFAKRFLDGRVPQLSFDETVDLLDIRPLLARRPRDLSGGEKQRVAIGRALLSAPRLLVLDEPLTGLDGERREQILQALERLRDRSSLPMIHISHSVSEVARLADTLVLLADGKVQHSGPAAELFSDPDLSSLIGENEAGSILQAKVIEQDVQTTLASVGDQSLHLPRLDVSTDANLRLRVKASDVLIASSRPKGISAQNILNATVDSITARPNGDVLVALLLGQQRLLARVTQTAVGDLQLRSGKSVYAIVKSTSVARTDIGNS